MVRWEESATKLSGALSSISENIRSNASSFSNIEADNAQAFRAVSGEGLDI